MKTTHDSHFNRRHRTAGGVLIITVLLASILGITLGSYLYWVRTQNLLVAESQTWNSALALAEAGIEEGLAQVNVSVGNVDPTAVANYGPSAQNNFGSLSGGAYGPKTNSSVSGGFYSVTIVPTNPGPTITAVGCTTLPIVSRQIARTVQVTTSIKALLGNSMSVISNVSMSGNGLTVDSYDSSDLARFPGGLYNPTNRMAGGDVASYWGIINVQNADIYGHVETGPTATVLTNNNGGRVGDLNWAGPGIQTGWWLTDFNMDFPDVQPPYTSGMPFPSPTAVGSTNMYTLGTGPYYANTSKLELANNEMLYVNGNAVLYVTGSFNMKNNNQTYLTIAPGCSLKLYVGSTNGAATYINLTQVNNQGNAGALAVYALPTTTSVVWNGNAAFIGTIYAPEATVNLGGGGNNSNYDFQGAITALNVGMNGHFNFHYDQNLKRTGGSSGFTVTSWREL